VPRKTVDKGPPAFVFPNDLSACLKLLARSEKKLEKETARITPLTFENKALRAHLLDTFKKSDLDGARGAGLVLSLVRTVAPTIEDWVAFFKFASKKGNDDLLPRKVVTAAWRARLEQKVAVPGTGTFDNVSLRVGTDRRGAK
jgi:hypothetical protein